MQENNFEKNIQQRMEELQMNPSGDVWLNVEATLKKKKDRKAVFLLFFLLVFCGAAGWIYFTSHPLTTTKQIAKANPGGNQVKNASAAIVTHAAPADSSNKNLQQPPSDVSIKKEAAEEKDITDPGSKSFKQKQTAALVLQYATADNLPAATADENKTTLVKKQKNRFKTAAKTTVLVSGGLVETTDEPVANTSLLRQPAIFTLAEIKANKTRTVVTFNAQLLAEPAILQAALVTNNTTKQTSSANKKNRVNSNKKITTALSFSAGRAATANNYLGKIPNNTFYDYLSSSPLTSGAGVPDSLLAVNRNASPVKPGVGFDLGILFIKKLTAHSNISAGIHYTLLTTSNTTGEQVVVDSPGQGSGSQEKAAISFKAGTSKKYQNYYHFIQVPIEFSSQLSRFNKHNIFFEGGISISQLVHTNALQFDNASHQYFKDNSFFNKTVAGFSAGFSVNLSKDNTKDPLVLGPAFYYSFTPLASSGLYAGSHYSFLGLRLQKNIGNK